MEKHWTAYLPEAGSIMRKGKDIQYQHGLLVQAKAEVQQLVRKIADMEDEAFQIARTGLSRKLLKPSRKPNKR